MASESSGRTDTVQTTTPKTSMELREGASRKDTVRTTTPKAPLELREEATRTDSVQTTTAKSSTEPREGASRTDSVQATTPKAPLEPIREGITRTDIIQTTQKFPAEPKEGATKTDVVQTTSPLDPREGSTRSDVSTKESTHRKETPPSGKDETNTGVTHSPGHTDVRENCTDGPAVGVRGKVTSEDSGVTRGDQVSSDSGPAETHREPRKHGSRRCKQCGTSRRHRRRRQAKGTCDDYYTKVIRGGTVTRRPDSWASDMSWDEYWDRGYGPALCADCGHFIHPRSRFATVRSDAPWRKDCSCATCWERAYLDRLRKSLRRGSVRSRYGGSVLCTCGRDGADRRVKFAEKSQLGADSHQEAPAQDPTNGSLSKGSGSSVTFDLSEPSPHEADDDVASERKDKYGSHRKSDIPLSKADFSSLQPWEVEDWERFVRHRMLKKKRRKALFMGLAALAFVVFIGLTVAVVMVYLRRKQL